MKGKLIQLQNSLNTKFKELKGKIEATIADLKGKMANITAGKIDAGEMAELKKNLSFAFPNYDTFVKSKCMTQTHHQLTEFSCMATALKVFHSTDYFFPFFSRKELFSMFSVSMVDGIQQEL